jgi:hypothetical protein
LSFSIIFSSGIDNFPHLLTLGAYPEAHVDINLSNDDKTVHPPEHDAPANQKVLAGDDIGDVGASSAEPTFPGLIRSDMPEKSKPFVVD